MAPTLKITTREAAQRLCCRPAEAIALLRAANIRTVRCGSAHLWDAASVEQLAAILCKSSK